MAIDAIQSLPANSGPRLCSKFPLQGKAKWDAWNGKKGMEQVKKTAATQRNVMTMVSLKASIDLLIDNVQTEAKEKYVAFAAQLKEKHGVKE